MDARRLSTLDALRRPVPRALALALVLVVTGCREVRTSPAEQQDATASSATGATHAVSSGSSASAGASGAGGSVASVAAAGGDGGSHGDGGAGGAGTGSGGEGGALAAPDPVPGCEELVWVGEPLWIEVRFWPAPRVATLASGDVGLVYIDDEPNPSTAESLLLAEPFAAWPPVLGATAIAMTSDDPNGFYNEDPRISARDDGTFALMVPGQHAGVVARYGEVPDHVEVPGLLTVLPTGDAAYRMAWDEDGDWRVDHLPTLDSAPVFLGVLPPHPCWTERTIILPDGSFLLSQGPSSYCEENVTLRLTRGSTAGLEEVASLPSTGLWDHALVPRADGAWLALAEVTHLTVLSLDATGAPGEPAWVMRRPLHAWFFAMAPWRGGFALAEFTGDDGRGGWGVRAVVSDGVHTTTSSAQRADCISSAR